MHESVNVSLDFLKFFLNFLRLWCEKKTRILLQTLEKFYSWSVSRLDDKNLTGYGNHN